MQPVFPRLVSNSSSYFSFFSSPSKLALFRHCSFLECSSDGIGIQKRDIALIAAGSILIICAYKSYCCFFASHADLPRRLSNASESSNRSIEILGLGAPLKHEQVLNQPMVVVSEETPENLMFARLIAVFEQNTFSKRDFTKIRTIDDVLKEAIAMNYGKEAVCRILLECKEEDSAKKLFVLLSSSEKIKVCNGLILDGILDPIFSFALLMDSHERQSIIKMLIVKGEYSKTVILAEKMLDGSSFDSRCLLETCRNLLSFGAIFEATQLAKKLSEGDKKAFRQALRNANLTNFEDFERLIPVMNSQGTQTTIEIRSQETQTDEIEETALDLVVISSAEIPQAEFEKQLLEIVRFAGLEGNRRMEGKIPCTAEELRDLALKEESIRMSVCKAFFSCDQEELAIGLVVVFSDYEKNTLCEWLIANNMSKYIYSFVLTMDNIYVTQACNMLIAKEQYVEVFSLCSSMPSGYLMRNRIWDVVQNLYLKGAHKEAIGLVKFKLEDSDKMDFCSFLGNSAALVQCVSGEVLREDMPAIPTLADEHMCEIALSMGEGSEEKKQMIGYFQKRNFQQMVERLTEIDLT